MAIKSVCMLITVKYLSDTQPKHGWNVHRRTNLILGLVDVDGTNHCECFLGFEIKRPWLVHLGFQPISDWSVLAFKWRRYPSARKQHVAILQGQHFSTLLHFSSMFGLVYQSQQWAYLTFFMTYPIPSMLEVQRTDYTMIWSSSGAIQARCDGSLITTLLPIYSWMCQWNKLHNLMHFLKTSTKVRRLHFWLLVCTFYVISNTDYR